MAVNALPASIPRPLDDLSKVAVHLSTPMFAAFLVSPFFHGTHQTLKLPIFALAVFAAICFLLCSSGRLFVHRTIIQWTVFFVAVGLFWVELGVVNRTPGAIATTTLYVMWPVVFLLFINLMNQEKQFRRLAIAFFIVCWAIVIADIGYVAEQLGFIPGRFFTLIESRNGFSLTPVGPAYTSSRVGVMLFAIPVLAAIIVHRWKVGAGKRLVLMSWLLLLAMLLLTFASQRRAIYVLLFVTPFIALFLEQLAPSGGPYRSRGIQLAIACCLAVMFGLALAYFGIAIDFASRLADLVQGFDFSGRAGPGDIETNARALQLRAMLATWMDAPILGVGHGGTVSLIRDNDMPWAYELTYVALLFQTGTLGFLAYLSGILWTIYRLVVIIRDPTSPLRLYACAMLNGLIGLLIGSATNPYLVTFDSLWAVFMPIGLINLELMRKDAGNNRNRAI